MILLCFWKELQLLPTPNRTQRLLICGLREDVICSEHEDQGVDCSHGIPAMCIVSRQGGLPISNSMLGLKHHAGSFDGKTRLIPSKGQLVRSSAEIGSLAWELLSKLGVLVERLHC